MSTIPCITVKKYIQINMTIIQYIQKIVVSSSMEKIRSNANYEHNRVYMQT
jgi:hypothetical protein